MTLMAKTTNGLMLTMPFVLINAPLASIRLKNAAGPSCTPVSCRSRDRRHRAAAAQRAGLSEQRPFPVPEALDQVLSRGAAADNDADMHHGRARRQRQRLIPEGWPGQLCQDAVHAP